MATFTITSTADTANDAGIGQVDANGNYVGTLREAINYANQNAATNPQTVTTINVADSIKGQTITLAGNLPLVATSVTLDGNGVTVDGGSAYRGFLISGIASDGQNATATTVNISNLTFQNVTATGGAGGGLGAGGAVFVGPAANVTLTNVNLANAEAVGGAGGSDGIGGGGGLGGAGGTSGGGGLFFMGGDGAARGGGGGGITSAGAGSSGTTGGKGGSGLDGLGGGGGGAGVKGGAAGGTGASSGSGVGGSGGFGGGGGGGVSGAAGGFGGGGGESIMSHGTGGAGGFGGGGGQGATGGDGGFGGGGGGGGSGGFGGGSGSDGGGGGALGGAVFVAAGGSLTIAGTSSETGGTVTGGAGGTKAGSAYGAGIFYEGGTAAAPATLTFGAGDQSVTDQIADLNGAAGNSNTSNGLGGTGGVTALAKTGVGTLTLGSTNTYSGGTTFGAGEISVAADGNLGAAAGGLTFNGGALQVTGTAFTMTNRAITWGAKGGGFDIANAGDNFTVSQDLVSGGALTKTGDGMLTLAGTNTYSGGTTLAGGELSAASDGNLGATSGALTFNGGALQVTGTAFTSTARTISWGADGGGFDIADAGNNFTVSQSLTDGGALTKTGAGTLTLSANNTYTGGTEVDAGTLSIASDGNLGNTSGGLTLAGGTLETTAAITSTRGIAVSGAGTVQVDTGDSTTLSGIVADGASSGLLFKAGAGTLTLSGANTYGGGTQINSGKLAISSDGNLGAFSGLTFGGGTLETTASFSSGRLITLGQNGQIQVDSGVTTTLSGRIQGGAGLVKSGSGTLMLSGGANMYSGNTTITGGTLDLAARVTTTQGPAGTGAISFQAATSGGATELDLETSAQNIGGTFGNTLDSFGTGDTLDLKNFAFNSMRSSITPVNNPSTGNNQFTAYNASGQAETFNLTNSATQYVASDDGNGGTTITSVCYASGTSIRTVRGDISVEHLTVGDCAITSSGAHRPIKWLGHRTVDCRNHPRPHEVMPVRILAHAFGANRPARDLYVSPGHSICVDVVGEVLIPAIALVNGATIAQVEVDEVTYWHVELDSHDVILAENLAAESYLDMGNRAFFAENDVVILDPALEASPDASMDADPAQRTHADYCRPFHLHGPLVDAVRAQMRARALALGWRLSAALDAHLEVDGRRVEPVVRDGAMRFLVPAGASDVWLVSPAVRPCDINGSSDARPLGIDLRSLQVGDGFAPPREIRIDDPRLDAGFSHIEDGHRWTAGRARLPAELWADCPDAFFLRVDLGGPVARWVAPAAGVDVRADARMYG